MCDLYLIAHKVRGEPAFDVAHRMECSLCAGHGHDLDGYCHECDSLGYWWIIGTSGHRAYPYWHADLNGLHYASPRSPKIHPIEFEALVDAMPPNLPDHYPHRAEPNRDLVSLLGLIHKPLAQPIKRRF